MNEENSGLSTKDAQAAICKGSYGGKEWPASEKQAACERYKQLTGTNIEHDSGQTEQLILPIVGIVLVIGVAVVIYYYQKQGKSKKRR